MRASGRVAGNIAGSCNVNVSPGRRSMPHARATRRPVFQINDARTADCFPAQTRVGFGLSGGARYGRLRAFPVSTPRPRDILRCILETGRRGYTDVGAHGGRLRGGDCRYASGGLGVYAIRLPAPPFRGANSSRIIPFMFSWAAAGRGQRSPGKNATGPFRLRLARTLQGETRYARYRWAG